ncbi:MAG: aminotransferase class V-fold PLP-dependent enzyme [Bacteroidota bacterium]
MNWNDVRNEFPVCNKMVYLNPAGGSPLSKSAYKEARRYYDEMLELGDAPYDEWMKRTSDVRKQVAGYIGASPSEIGFTTNTSHGMNIIAHILKNRGGVLTMKDEFPSTTIPWLNQGVQLKMVDPVNGMYLLESIKDALTPDIKIIMTSYVQYATGFRQDLKTLGKFCKENGYIFVVNATQALPVFPIDVKQMHIDFLVFTGLKWATAGYGIGGLYIDEKWLQSEKLPLAGWQSVQEPEAMNNLESKIRQEASAIESGCPHFPNIFALGGALTLFEAIGNYAAAERILELNAYLNKKLVASGFKVLSTSEDKYRSGITIVKHNNPKPVVKNLAEKNILVSARGEGLRISVNVFNNEQDIDTLCYHLKNYIN